MKIDLARPRWTGVLGRLTAGSNGVRSNGKRQEALAELRQVWLAMALHVIASSKDPAPTVLGITSAARGEGKTTDALALSSSLAEETSVGVVLVECDVSNPTLAQELGLEAKPGLVEYVSRGVSLADVLRSTNLSNLKVAVAGGEAAYNGELDIQSLETLTQVRRQLPGILGDLKQDYQYIILDMPPVLTNPNAKEMVKATDGVFLAARAGVTSLVDMSRAVQEVSDGRLMGVVLAGATAPIPHWLSNLLDG